MNRKLILAASAALLAGCAGMAVAQSGSAPPPDDAVAAATAGPRPAGPPGPPQPVTLAKRPDASGGEALFVEMCIMCHGANGMGTSLLGRAGRPQPLELRPGLPAAFYVSAARNGIGNMPAIPRGEVSDEQLQAIADYLAAGPHPEAVQ